LQYLGADGVADRAPAIDRPGEAVRFDAAHRAIERHPGHHLKMDELTRAAAHLPNSLVGLAPVHLEEIKQGTLQPPRPVIKKQPHAPRLPKQIHHFPIDVELKLTNNGVAHTYRPRTAV